MTVFCWTNGQWYDADQALISPLDRGFLYGDGVFETLRSHCGRFFRLERHLARLHHGMDYLGLDPGDALEEALDALPQCFGLVGAESVVARLSVTRGDGWLEVRPASAAVVTLLARQAPLGPPEAGRAVLSSVVRDATSPISDLKTCNWLPSILARREAEGLGYNEAILCNSLGYLAEASSSNLFWARAGELFTPAIECGALPGITREAVIEAARTAGIAVFEGNFLPEDLAAADAAFLTNSVFGIKQLVSCAMSGRDGDAPMLREDLHGVVASVRRELDRLIASETEPSNVP